LQTRARPGQGEGAGSAIRASTLNSEGMAMNMKMGLMRKKVDWRAEDYGSVFHFDLKTCPDMGDAVGADDVQVGAAGQGAEGRTDLFL
jgi:hypothetical protein